ncbi:hypothetical protein AB4K20DRAFT_1864668 [Rhizopus microsporus]
MDHEMTFYHKHGRRGIFDDKENEVNQGESAGDSQDASDSPGFEVDLRVVKDTMSRRRKEADKAKVEIARFNPSMIKITNDRTKLLIESKTTLVKLIKEVPEKNKDYCYPWSTDHREQSNFVLSEARSKRFNAMMDVASCNLMDDDCSSNIDNNSNNNNNNDRPASWTRGTWIPPITDKKKRLPDIIYFITSQIRIIFIDFIFGTF